MKNKLSLEYCLTLILMINCTHSVASKSEKEVGEKPALSPEKPKGEVQKEALTQDSKNDKKIAKIKPPVAEKPPVLAQTPKSILAKGPQLVAQREKPSGGTPDSLPEKSAEDPKGEASHLEAKQPKVASPSSPTQAVAAQPPESKCPEVAIVDKLRSETYASFPFKSGEIAKYELDFGAIHVGYGFMKVGAPVKYSIITGTGPKGAPQKKSLWHMAFSGHAFTGDWYSSIYRGNDKVLAYSRPFDFSISKFYVEERAETILKSVHVKKHLNFQQGLCRVLERKENLIDKKQNAAEHELTPGAVDALGAFYKLRTLDYSKGPQRFTVYSSAKNWLLEAVPQGVDKIEVPAGTFEADRVKMKTYLGQKLEQRGDLTIWIARNHPNRPLVRIEGEFKFGDIDLDLAEFTPGK